MGIATKQPRLAVIRLPTLFENKLRTVQLQCQRTKQSPLQARHDLPHATLQEFKGPLYDQEDKHQDPPEHSIPEPQDPPEDSIPEPQDPPQNPPEASIPKQQDPPHDSPPKPTQKKRATRANVSAKKQTTLEKTQLPVPEVIKPKVAPRKPKPTSTPKPTPQSTSPPAPQPTTNENLVLTIQAKVREKADVAEKRPRTSSRTKSLTVKRSKQPLIDHVVPHVVANDKIIEAAIQRSKRIETLSLDAVETKESSLSNKARSKRKHLSESKEALFFTDDIFNVKKKSTSPTVVTDWYRNARKNYLLEMQQNHI